MRWLRRRWARQALARFRAGAGADMTHGIKTDRTAWPPSTERRVHYDAKKLGEFATWLEEEAR